MSAHKHKPCSVCGRHADPGVLTVIGRWCTGCYQAYRDGQAQDPRDVREFRTAAVRAGLRVE